MVSRIGAAALIVAAMAIAAPTVRAATAGKGPPEAPAAPPAKAPNTPSSEGRNDTGTAPAAPQISQDAAARARMHECAHQWSSIKKAGNAGATTWKEFSATCLVVSR